MREQMDAVGIIGVGVMGMTAGRKLIESGRRVVVFDSASTAADKARQAGAQVAASPAEVAALCPVILMFLPGPAQIGECVSGPTGLLQTACRGQIIVDMSTVDPGTTQRMGVLAREKGVGYVDAPVLGRPAKVGKWALPVGGQLEDIERCRPILEVLAAKVIHIGESGAGNKIKLLNQMMFSAINAMTAEMMAVAEKVGVPPKLLYETITSSQAATVSNLFVELGKNIAADSYDQPTFSVDLLCKDVRLAIEMATAHGAPPPLAGTIQFLNETAQAQGFGAQDTSVMWKALSAFWKQSA
jgi:3-hydroxyisobutyrate dehydrogenase-like beta-hydroxyacid dehydrogenase